MELTYIGLVTALLQTSLVLGGVGVLFLSGYIAGRYTKQKPFMDDIEQVFKKYGILPEQK